MIASICVQTEIEHDDVQENKVENSCDIFLKNVPPQISEHDIVDAINQKLGTDSIKESFATQRRKFQNSVKSLKITLKTQEFAKKIVDEKKLQVKDSLIEVQYYVDMRGKHADNETPKTITRAYGPEMIQPGPGNLIVSGRTLSKFITSEDVYKVFSFYGKLNNAVLKSSSRNQKKIVFLEFIEKESAKQAIQDLNDKPLPHELIRRLNLQTLKRFGNETDIHYYQDSDFIGGEDFNIEKVLEQDPTLTKDTLKVAYIQEKQTPHQQYPRTTTRTNTNTQTLSIQQQVNYQVINSPNIIMQDQININQQPQNVTIQEIEQTSVNQQYQRQSHTHNKSQQFHQQQQQQQQQHQHIANFVPNSLSSYQQQPQTLSIQPQISIPQQQNSFVLQQQQDYQNEFGQDYEQMQYGRPQMQEYCNVPTQNYDDGQTEQYYQRNPYNQDPNYSKQAKLNQILGFGDLTASKQDYRENMISENIIAIPPPLPIPTFNSESYQYQYQQEQEQE